MQQNQPSNHSFHQSRFRWTTDPTFYPTARLAMEAPREKIAYVAALAPDRTSRSDALLVVDVDPASPSYGTTIGRVDLPNTGDELHYLA
jgi:methanethiol oxidase